MNENCGRRRKGHPCAYPIIGRRANSEGANRRLVAPGTTRFMVLLIYAAGSEVQVDELDPPAHGAGHVHLGPKSLGEAERHHILQVLRDVGDNKTEAAQMLGLARSTLVLKLKSYSRETK
ncbi:MAG: hypothetical protein NTW87_10085 [Planctomycetota bacterium]|nr:hypothetical protein [Planctomycetota bacterium]